MSHYYDENPEVQSDEKTIQYFYHKSQLKLTTDAGVFSKGKVDFGSDLLVQTFLNEHPPGPSKRIIDVGCGYGPIGLMIAKVSPHHQITMKRTKSKIKLIMLSLQKVMVCHKLRMNTLTLY